MKENKLLYNVTKGIYSFLLKIIYNPKIEGLENIPNDGAIIFAGNHMHAYDPLVVMSHTKRYIHFFSKKEIFKGFMGKIYEEIGLISVDREKTNPAAMLSAMKLLKRGGTIGIFPEGTRNRTDEELLEFKVGAVILATRAKVPIVPFGLTGKFKPFRSNVRIVFGKPINFDSMEIEEANDYLKEEIRKLMNTPVSSKKSKKSKKVKKSK